jgi:hypothetical protein
MSAFREPGFKERQEAAAKAKQAALDKLRARQKPVEPPVVQQADRASGAKAGSGPKKGRATAQKTVSEPAEKKGRAAAPAAEQKGARKARRK